MNLVFFWLNWKFLCSLYKKGRGLLQKSYLRILFSANFAEHIFSIWILAFFLHLSFMELFRSIVYQQKKSALRFFFIQRLCKVHFLVALRHLLASPSFFVDDSFLGSFSVDVMTAEYLLNIFQYSNGFEKN